MSSIIRYFIRYLIVVLSIILNLHLASTAQNSSSTCPTNLNSTCTVLPFNLSNPPDVWLSVPDLHVDEISILVKNITAQVSLTANVASLVSLNVGVGVSIDKVNLTILGVKAQVQLAVYLNNVAAMVTRTMASLDLNPNLTSIVDTVVGTVNKTLGTSKISKQLVKQVIDNAGNIVNQVVDTAGNVVSSTVTGTITDDMTFTGVIQRLENGHTIKEYTYLPPAGSSQTVASIVYVEFDNNGNVVRTTIGNPAATSATTR